MKPASKLPWKFFDDHDTQFGSPTSCFLAEEEWAADRDQILYHGADWPMKPEDRAYIVHAANTYPELVAALKAAADDLIEIGRGVDGLDGEPSELRRIEQLCAGRQSVLSAVLAKCEGGAE